MTSSPPFPSFTKTWHNDTYPALSPEDRATGKTIIITGASRGIGRAAARSFARAGAAHIALLGRRQEALEETQLVVQAANNNTTTSIHICPSTSPSALAAAASRIGPWDILLLNAGIDPVHSPIQDADVGNWWTAFETNVKGALLTTQAFLPTANKSRAEKPSIISVNASLPFLSSLPPWSGSSAYTSSKLALAQMMQHLSAEQPDVNVISVHPGVVATDMFVGDEEVKKEMKKIGALDEAELPGDFFVWCSTEEAGFLDGKFVFANWDVEELKARKGEILEGGGLRVGLEGWPFA